MSAFRRPRRAATMALCFATDYVAAMGPREDGFHNDTTPRYDEAAATLAWQRTLEWFSKYLS